MDSSSAVHQEDHSAYATQASTSNWPDRNYTVPNIAHHTEMTELVPVPAEVQEYRRVCAHRYPMIPKRDEHIYWPNATSPTLKSPPFDYRHPVGTVRTREHLHHVANCPTCARRGPNSQVAVGGFYHQAHDTIVADLLTKGPVEIERYNRVTHQLCSKIIRVAHNLLPPVDKTKLVQVQVMLQDGNEGIIAQTAMVEQKEDLSPRSEMCLFCREAKQA